MDDLMNRLQMMVSANDADRNQISREYQMNPFRKMLQEVMVERKDMLRSKMNMSQLYDIEEQSQEIEEILEQFAKPTFPLEEVNTEKDEEWQPLERKYMDGIKRIEEEMIGKLDQMEKDLADAVNAMQNVLRDQRDYRPLDERDLCNANETVKKQFETAKHNIRGDAATKILVLRREIEQQGRKRRNFDKNTTDILQNWFHDHRQNPYPSDQEKLDLAKRCNIKISQVNNWFGNQRIRTKQQAQKMEEEEERERQRAAAEAANNQLIAEQMLQGTGTSAIMGMNMMNTQMANSQLQTLVIQQNPQSTLLNNSTGFMPQQHYFQTGQMVPTDNLNGQQFYTDFEAFQMISSDGEQHFNPMQYMQ